MFICKNCGQSFTTQTKFCSACGSSAIEQQVVQQPQFVQQPQPAAPVVPPAVKKVRKELSPNQLLGVFGGISGISSALVALMSLIFTIMSFASDDITQFGRDYVMVESYALAGIAILCALFAFVLGAAGLILTNKAHAAGEETQLSKLGNMLGAASALLSIAVFALAIFAVFVTYSVDVPKAQNPFGF